MRELTVRRRKKKGRVMAAGVAMTACGLLIGAGSVAAWRGADSETKLPIAESIRIVEESSARNADPRSAPAAGRAFIAAKRAILALKKRAQGDDQLAADCRVHLQNLQRHLDR